jgi:hypothetical protein
MRHFQILYKTASGVNKLTHSYVCNSAKEAIEYTTDFVRANLISVHEVAAPTMEWHRYFFRKP